MSDDIRCDVCQKDGRRRRGKHCPEGWFYAEVMSEDRAEDGAIVVTTCSPECRKRFWLPGPGDLRTSPEYIVVPKANRDVREVFDGSDEGPAT
jgi:hypothetical protein